MNLFQCRDYKDFLQEKIEDNEASRGYKSTLAEAAGCHKAYLSQVINSHVHLTPEHAAALVRFWGLNDLEREYFLNLVDLARAGTPALRQIIEERLQTLRASHENLGERFKKPKIAEVENQAAYYSAWYYSAVHILTTIPGAQTVEAISQRLRLPTALVHQVLAAIKNMGLVTQKKDLWTAVSFDIHLPKDSPLTHSNHVNWRQRAISEIELKRQGTVHFTAVYSLSRADYEHLKNELLKFITKSRQTARDSKEEVLMSFTCDLFDM